MPEQQKPNQLHQHLHAVISPEEQDRLVEQHERLIATRKAEHVGCEPGPRLPEAEAQEKHDQIVEDATWIASSSEHK